jgi:hypothetical protein
MVSDFSSMERVTTKEAAKALGIGVDSLQFLMQQDKLPIGYVTRKPNSPRRTYFIFKESLENYIDSLKNNRISSNAMAERASSAGRWSK